MANSETLTSITPLEVTTVRRNYEPPGPGRVVAPGQRVFIVSPQNSVLLHWAVLFEAVQFPVFEQEPLVVPWHASVLLPPAETISLNSFNESRIFSGNTTLPSESRDKPDKKSLPLITRSLKSKHTNWLMILPDRDLSSNLVRHSSGCWSPCNYRCCGSSYFRCLSNSSR